MTPDVVAVSRKMDLRDLAKLFLEKGISGAPVIDDDGGLVGVISQTDLIFYQLTRDDELRVDSHFYQSARVEGHSLPRGFQVEDLNTGRVEDVMTPIVHAVNETTPVPAIARMMTDEHIHRVIVVRGRRVTGIISALDVLRAMQTGGPAAKKRPSDKKTPANSGIRRAKSVPRKRVTKATAPRKSKAPARSTQRRAPVKPR